MEDMERNEYTEDSGFTEEQLEELRELNKGAIEYGNLPM